jgi:hypothetical protein
MSGLPQGSLISLVLFRIIANIVLAGLESMLIITKNFELSNINYIFIIVEILDMERPSKDMKELLDLLEESINNIAIYLVSNKIKLIYFIRSNDSQAKKILDSY